MSDTINTGNGTEQQVPGPASKDPAEGGRATVDKALGKSSGGSPADHPENTPGAAKATADNDLTTGHSTSDDGGADNAR